MDETKKADQERCDDLIARGEAALAAGDVAAGRAAFAEAADVARRLGSRELYARAVLGFGSGAVPIGFGYEPNEVLIALLEEALRDPPGDRGLKLRLQARLAIELYWTDRSARRKELVDAAVLGADQSGKTEDLLVASHARYVMTLPTDEPSVRIDAVDQLVDLAERTGDLRWVFETLFLRLHVLAELGRTFEYDEGLARLERIADALDTPLLRARAIHARGARTIVDGRLDEAEQRFAEAIAQGHGAPEVIRANGAALLMVRWLQGRVAEVEPHVRVIRERHPSASAARSAMIMFLAELGRTGEAVLELERLEREGFEPLRRDHHVEFALFCYAVATVHIGQVRYAAQLRALLAPYEGRHIASPGSTLSLGTPLLPLGMLASIMGNYETAVMELQTALESNRMAGNRVMTVFAMCELAAALRSSGDPRARACAEQALGLASELRLERFERRAKSLLAAAEDRFEAELRRDAGGWSVSLGPDAGRLPDLKGLGFLARLLPHPYEEIHVLDLASSPGDPEADAIKASLARDPGPVIDASARDAYRRRLHDLASERTAARAAGDAAREEQIDAEMDAISGQLAAATGLHGRSRSLTGPAERGRISVTKALRTAIARIGDISPPLADHLDASIRTGAFCSYFPRESDRPAWRL